MSVITATGGQDWLDERFIDLYAIEVDGEAPYVDNLDAFSYHHVLQTETLGKSTTSELDDPVEFVRERIRAGTYLTAYIDDHYLEGKVSPHVHEYLVFGFDDGEQAIRMLGFDRDRIFAPIDVGYAAFSTAFKRASANMKDDHLYSSMVSQVQLLTPPPRYPEYSVDKARQEFQFLLEEGNARYDTLDREGWWWWVQSRHNAKQRSKTGLAAQSALVQALTDLEELGAMGVDYRAFHTLYEHKIGAATKMRRVLRNFGDEDSAAQVAEVYRELTETFNRARLAVLRHNHERQSAGLRRLAAELSRATDNERTLLERILRRIT